MTKEQSNKPHIQWAHYIKTCSNSATGAYLSAETYKPITGYLKWDLLQEDCDEWAESVNREHELGHGGYAEFVVVDAPPEDWLEKQIEYTVQSIQSKNKRLKLLKKTLTKSLANGWCILKEGGV